MRRIAGRADSRELALRVIGEAVAVARAQGIRPEKVVGLDPSWISWREGGPGLLELEDGLLIPFVNDICVGIRPEAGRIEVILPDGLVELFRGQQ